MPILPAEPAVFPETLLDDAVLTTLAGERSWWALHTKPRQEKGLARNLHERRAPFYLPLVPRRLQIRGRCFTSFVPLFPGYVFLLGSRDDRLMAVATRHVVRALDVPDQDGLWRDLRQVYRLIATGAPVTPEERLGPGSAIEIHSGPLAGLRGVIVRAASGHRFVVEVDFIQRGASVLIDAATLTPITAELPGA
jgi:transcriptional antiterminator RfaH